MDAEPEEGVEEAQLQEVVEDVGPGKAGTVLLVGIFAEGEMGREVVVGEETDDITDGEGDVDVDEVLQQPIDGVVDGDRQHTHDSEAEDLTKGLFLEQIPEFHGAKVVNNS